MYICNWFFETVDLDNDNSNTPFTCSFEFNETLSKLKVEIDKLLNLYKNKLFQLASWKVLVANFVLSFDFHNQQLCKNQAKGHMKFLFKCMYVNKKDY